MTSALDKVNVARLMAVVKNEIAGLVSEQVADKNNRIFDPTLAKEAADRYLAELQDIKCIKGYEVRESQKVDGFKIVDGHRPKLLLKLVSESGVVEWLPQKRYRSRRKARLDYKRNLRYNFYMPMSIRPIAPIRFIQLEVTVTPQGAVITDPES